MTLAREIRRLAWPAIAASLLQTAVFLADRVMLGRSSRVDLAAMHIAGNLEWSVFMVMSAFTVGTLARSGMARGARDAAAARRTAVVSLRIATALGLALAVLAWPLLALLPSAFPRASLEVVAGARGYLAFTLGASPFMLVGLTATAILQGSGDTRTPLVVGVVANLVHLASNAVLILGAFGVAPMGARGAGISTALAFALEAVWLVATLRRRGRALDPSCVDPASRGGLEAEASAIGRIAWPAVGERLAQHTGFTIYTAIIALLGDVVMAGHQALLGFEAICFTTADGFGVAAAAIVAKKIGEGRPDEARRAAGLATAWAVASLSVFALAIAVFGERGLALFGADESVRAMGATAIPIAALAQPFMAAGIVLAQAVRGAGATRISFAVAVLGSFLVRVVAVWTFGVKLGLGLFGVWIGSTADWAVRAALLVVVGATLADRLLADASTRYAAERGRHPSPSAPGVEPSR